MIGEISGEGIHGKLRFRDDHHAGGVLIEPMNDTRTRHAANSFHVGAVVQDGVYECSRIVAGRRVYDESGRLVDDKDVVIFEDDVERNVLRLRLGGHRWWNGDVDDIGFFDLGAGLGGNLTIHLDESGVDKPLQPRPGKVGIEGGQADVEAFAHQNCQAL